MEDPIPPVESGNLVAPSPANSTPAAQRRPPESQKAEVETPGGIEQTGTFRMAPVHWEHPHVGLEVFPLLAISGIIASVR
jgi:hypothetical protein